MKRWLALVALAAVACPGVKGPSPARCSSASASCAGAQSLLEAANNFGKVRRDLVVASGESWVVGRGLQRVDGVFRPLPLACAKPMPAASQGGEQEVAFSFVGVSVDGVLVSGDADLAGVFPVSLGGSHEVVSVNLSAVALVREHDPQFFEPSMEVAANGASCTCADATHFVGAVKYGAMIAYEMRATRAELRGGALSFVRAKLESQSSDVRESRAGDLEIEGGGPRSAPRLRVKKAVPIAYAVHPLSDVCRFSFPEPEVSPQPLDFGFVPSGKEAKKQLHVVNRAAFDVTFVHAEKSYELPGRSSVDVPIHLTPKNERVGCETEREEESLLFSPRDASTHVSPKQHAIRVEKRVDTGRATLLLRETVDTGLARFPSYKATARKTACPADYVLVGCEIQGAQCGHDGKSCDDYTISARSSDLGCAFACDGPYGLLHPQRCRFDAVTQCALQCRGKGP